MFTEFNKNLEHLIKLKHYKRGKKQKSLVKRVDEL